MVRVGCQIRERVYLKRPDLSRDRQTRLVSLPEYEVWIPPCLAGINLISSILLGQGHLHELGCVQSEGEDGHWDDVDQKSLCVAHCLQNFTFFREVYKIQLTFLEKLDIWFEQKVFHMMSKA